MIDSIQLERMQPPDVIDDSSTNQRSSRLWIVVALIFLTAVFLNFGLFGFRTSIVSGGSMEPGWHRGDMVLSRSVDAAHLKLDDVVTFGVGDRRLVHRIVAIEQVDGERQFVTQGDNNPAADLPVPETDVEGKVILSVPVVGLPVLVLQSLISEVIR